MKTKRLWMTSVAVIFLAVLITNCRKDDFVTIDGVCPLVISTDPANLATGVPLDKIITATFNEQMDPETITPESMILQSSAKGLQDLSGSLTYDGNSEKMSFKPNAKLLAGTTYSVTIMSTVKDLTGNALQEDYVWTFSTGSTLAPMVISTDPADAATNVFLNKTVTATFNQAMDPLSLTTTTVTVKQGVTPVAGTVSYSGTTVSFKPTSILTSGTLYTGTITSGAKNAAGTNMADDYVWNFTTGTVAAPKVNSTDPLNLATGVALNKVVSAVFSEAMDPLTITTTSFTLMTGATPVAGTVNYSGTTATFTPTSLLLSGNTYTATITTDAKNPAGIPIANDYVWKFSTGAPLGPVGVDLKSVARFGIIAGLGVSNQAGFSEIHDLDVGISPGPRTGIVGFPPGIIVNGAFYASDDVAPAGVPAMLTQAKQDLTDAYLFAANATAPAPVIIAGDQGGKTLAPGLYKSTSTLGIQFGDLTLDAQGDANAVWIFQIAAEFTTVGGGPFPSPTGGNVILSGGAQAKNVFWQVTSSAIIGDYTSFKGNILALTSITMGPYAKAEGRMLARNGSVVLTSTNIITKP
nr:Ig-like domain-containing protein [Bacteroidota bacterium]